MTQTFDVFTPQQDAGGHEIPQPAQVAPPPVAEPTVPEGAHLMPSGNWVQVVDARTLTRGDRKAMILKARTAEDSSRGLDILDALLTRLITAWSYPWPVPSADPDALDRVPIGDDDALDALILPAQKLIFPGTVTPDDHADPESPTAPSGA